jgi:hypothetical protein
VKDEKVEEEEDSKEQFNFQELEDLEEKIEKKSERPEKE